MNSSEMYLNDSHTSQTLDLDSTNHTAIGNSTEVPEFWDFETRFEFVFHGLLISCLGIFGLMGNLASIVILSRPQMRNSINTILIALVSCDILLILTSILMFSFTVFRHTGLSLFESYVVNVYPYAAAFVYPIAMIAQTASAYLTLAVTIERYLAVCWPLKARHLCTIGRAKMAVASVVGFALVYNIPRFFEITWQEEFDEKLQQNTTRYYPTELRINSHYISIYVTWMYLVFMYIIPFTTLAVFNFLTWLEMRRAIARRAQLSTQEQKEHNLATMLLMVVLVFFICNVLPLVVNILEMVGISNQQLIQVSNMLVTINSSVNILIYCTFGKKFRTVFMQIFFGKQPPYVLSSTSVLRTGHRASEPQGNGREIANAETVQLAASMKSSPQSNTSRKYSYNLQNDQNQSVRITIMEEYPTPSKKSVVKMVRITQSPRNHEDSSAMESSDAISKVNDCNGYNHLLKPIEGNGQHRKSTAC